MKSSEAHLIKKSEKSYRVARPTQTGFSSPATHYHEPRIDLNDVLVKNPSSTFFIRVVDDSFQDFMVEKHDVLIVDKSLLPKSNQLAIVVMEDCFQIVRMDSNSLDEMKIWGVITHVIKPTL